MDSDGLKVVQDFVHPQYLQKLLPGNALDPTCGWYAKARHKDAVLEDHYFETPYSQLPYTCEDGVCIHGRYSGHLGEG